MKLQLLNIKVMKAEYYGVKMWKCEDVEIFDEIGNL
ncbi:hypothetical protein SDC9_67009 [bioreactor metagenome]|uniref:Uncharacterized protein n=1 Tax=bioreactor metagenome TaxID=1076179 RepID=A0A644XXQ4_9ZZZZ